MLIRANILNDVSHHMFFTDNSIGVISDISYYGVIGEFVAPYEIVSKWSLVRAERAERAEGQ